VLNRRREGDQKRNTDVAFILQEKEDGEKYDPSGKFPGGSFCVTDRHKGEPFLQTKDIKMGDLEQF
jgi:hypothetical protein